MKEPSLRERKKAQSRVAIHEAAVRLFQRDGYDRITVAAVAAEAEVSVPTLFTYFPGGKPTLAVHADEDRAAAIRSAITDRQPDDSILTALESLMRSRGPFQQNTDESLQRLIASTPALREYASRRWTECIDIVAAALADERGSSVNPAIQAEARFALEAPDIASQAVEPGNALHEIFDHLRRGWAVRGGGHEN